MIVYGEILVAENFIIGGALLYITAQIYGRSPADGKSLLRFLLGAVMCSVFSLVIFLPVKAPVSVLMEAAFAPAVCCVVFGREKLWQKALAFLMATYFMGGVVMALLLATDNTGIYTASGIYTGDMKAGLLAAFIAMTLFASRKCILLVRKKKFYQEHVFDVKIVVEGEMLQVRGFLDTGNGLCEPSGGMPVAVAGEDLWQRLEKKEMLKRNRFCVIPYRSVGGSGVLIGVRTDYMEITDNRIKGCVIAKGEGIFSMEGETTSNCELLLSSEMVKGKF